MHNSDGLIYIDPNASPRKGVDILSDIQTVLQSNRSDIGAIVANANNINKWAKHKPFRNASVGFQLTPTQSTPELRSPDRLTAALAANFGLSLPRYGASAFKTHYADTWDYLKPRGLTTYNERYRVPDFDGYLHSCDWFSGPVTVDGITCGYYTIFNGYLSTPRTPYVFPGDPISFTIQCAEDPDTGTPGLLYPYTFYRSQASLDDLSLYYIGIAILDGNNNLWIKTGDQMRSHHTLNDIEAEINTTVPNSMQDGMVKFIPVLTSEQYSSWDDAPGLGQFIALDGAYLSRRIRHASSSITVTVTVSYSNGTVSMAFSVENNTSSAVTLSNLYAFVMSAESYYNESEAPFYPPVTQNYSTREYIEDNWATAAPHVPADNYWGLTNPPNIYLSDWVSGIGSPAYLTALGYNAYADFYSANGSSSSIAVGDVVTWTKTMNIGTNDGCGYYSDGVFVAACWYVGQTANVDYFNDINE